MFEKYLKPRIPWIDAAIAAGSLAVCFCGLFIGARAVSEHGSIILESIITAQGPSPDQQQVIGEDMKAEGIAWLYLEGPLGIGLTAMACGIRQLPED